MIMSTEQEYPTLKTVIDWENFLMYLAGPIDFADDGGVGWRDEWIEKLVKVGIKRNHILNPCKKALQGAQFDLDDEHRILSTHRKRKDWDGMCNMMSQIVSIDLRFVDLSSLILVNFPAKGREALTSFTSKFDKAYENLFNMEFSKNADVRDNLLDVHKCFYDVIETMAAAQVPTYGTIHEIVVARQQKKPVLIVWEGGKETCSGWIQWLVKPRNVFATVDELIAYLGKVADGEVAVDARNWLLLNLNKK